ncbi:MAG: hypothetical protein Q9209_005484 [Squamulea sp. 1 TL-2023]
MGRVTRQQAKIREAEGIPPSPPTELPAELGGTRRRKRIAKSSRYIITSETDEDVSSSSQQDPTVPDQTLREGNAGGYVHAAQCAESTREQQNSLQAADLFLLNFLPPYAVASPQHHGAEEITAPPEVIQTPTPSPSNTSALFAQILNPAKSPSGVGLAPKLFSPQSTGDQATVIRSVSTQTDGPAASIASPTSANTSRQSIQIVTRDVSTQTGHRPKTFRPMGRYGFDTGISILPNFCNITLHLDDGKEILISKVTASSIRKIGDIFLNDGGLSYEFNWLTPQEVGAAEAEAKDRAAVPEAKDLVSPANKRKRDEETDIPEAQRRRTDHSPAPTSAAGSALKTVAKPAYRSARSARRMQFMGKNGNGLGRSLKAMQTALPEGSPSARSDAGPYSNNGELLLSSKVSADEQHDDPVDSGPVASIATTNSAITDTASHGDPQFPLANADADLSGEAAITQSYDQTQQTPQSGSWLPKLVSSAIRYVPGIRRRQAPTATPQASMANVRIADQRAAQTEPRRPMATHSDFGQRLQNAQLATQKIFRTKENVDAMRKARAERERIKEEWAKLEEQKKITEEERQITEKEKQDVADAHRAALANQQTGAKRPRLSPRVIPNPKGASYGLDLDFFGDSDESDNDQDASPSRKSRRTSGPDHSPSTISMANTPNIQNGNTTGSRTSPNQRATEYTGSRFSDSPPNVFGQSMAQSGPSISKDDPRFNHSGHFEVPWSPSSSEDDSGEEEDVATPVVDKSQSVPASATHDTVGQGSDNAVSAAASPQKPAQGPMFPPVTPTSKRPVAPPETRRDPEAAKTLERNRELLRAKIAGQSRSVLSPKDIQTSPSKAHVSQAITQQTVQPTAPALFFQPKQASLTVPDAPIGIPIGSQDKDDEFSILGAASPRSPKSNARRLAETLPTVQGKLSGLQSYDHYQQTMDSKVKELLESSWKASDETASGEEFRPAFMDFVASQEQESPVPAMTRIESLRQLVDDDEAIDDEDHASLYEDEDDSDDEGNDNAEEDEPYNEEEALLDESEDDDGNTAITPPSATAFEDFPMDPTVAAFLKDHWTAEDEAYASDEFKTQLASAA